MGVYLSHFLQFNFGCMGFSLFLFLVDNAQVVMVPCELIVLGQGLNESSFSPAKIQLLVLKGIRLVAIGAKSPRMTPNRAPAGGTGLHEVSEDAISHLLNHAS